MLDKAALWSERRLRSGAVHPPPPHRGPYACSQWPQTIVGGRASASHLGSSEPDGKLRATPGCFRSISEVCAASVKLKKCRELCPPLTRTPETFGNEKDDWLLSQRAVQGPPTRAGLCAPWEPGGPRPRPGHTHPAEESCGTFSLKTPLGRRPEEYVRDGLRPEEGGLPWRLCRA